MLLEEGILQLCIKAVKPKLGENLLNENMFLPHPRVNENVLIVQQVTENIGDKALKGIRSIREARRYHTILRMAICANKGPFPLVTLMNTKTIISNLSKPACSL